MKVALDEYLAHVCSYTVIITTATTTTINQ
jgi:hypothetical protein